MTIDSDDMENMAKFLRENGYEVKNKRNNFKRKEEIPTLKKSKIKTIEGQIKVDSFVISKKEYKKANLEGLKRLVVLTTEAEYDRVMKAIKE